VFPSQIRRGLLLFVVSASAAAIPLWSPLSAVASMTAEPRLLVSDDGSNSLAEYGAGAAGEATPIATIAAYS
jgi:hypothetical protein